MNETTQADRDYPEDQKNFFCADGRICLVCGQRYSGRNHLQCRVCATPASVRAEVLELRGMLETLTAQTSTLCAEITALEPKLSALSSQLSTAPAAAPSP